MPLGAFRLNSLAKSAAEAGVTTGTGEYAVDFSTSTHIKTNAQPDTADTSTVNLYPAYTISMWVKVNAGSPGLSSGQGFIWEDFMNGNFPSRWQIEANEGVSKIQFESYNSSGARIGRTGFAQGTGASGGAISAGTWYWLAASYDSSSTNGFQVYIGALNGSPVAQNFLTNLTTTQTIRTNWRESGTGPFVDRLGIGARYAGNVQADCCISDLWFDTQRIDLSNSTNRQKFMTSSGLPADLGSDGSNVTGSQPDFFLSGPADSFATQLGSNTKSNTVTGTLTDCSNAPGE